MGEPAINPERGLLGRGFGTVRPDSALNPLAGTPSCPKTRLGVPVRPLRRGPLCEIGSQGGAGEPDGPYPVSST